MKKLLVAVILTLFACSTAWACPPSGCVDIMSKPPAENWGYVNGLGLVADIAFDGATVDAIEVITDEDNEDSGMRRVRITLDASGAESVVDATYLFQVRNYNSSGQLVSTSGNIFVATTASGDCSETGTIGSINCSSSYFGCFLNGCECKYECPGAGGCITLGSGCDFSFGDGCTCPYNWNNCDPFDPPCINPQLIAEYGNSCPAGQTCVVHITAWENI